ncbi:MAG: HAMP domain-containing histidine kinase [Spirochaetes bacterium]|nr:HAMP domain-containing histidine kinase [Spirochaetota bacterium]
MFLGSLRKISRKINLRLALLYTIVFILSSALLFGVIYFFFSSTLRKDDYQSIRQKLLELWASYEYGGLRSVGNQVSVEKLSGDRRFLLIRVADRFGNTLIVILPEAWSALHPDSLREIYSNPDRSVRRVQAGGTLYYLETASLNLADGNLLQVGMNVEARVFALKRFREIFTMVLFPLAVVSFAGGAALAARALRPLESLNSTIRKVIETGNIQERIPETGTRGDLDELVRFFNRMLDRVQRLMEGMTDSLDSVAHDMKTPLARMKMSYEAALQSPEDTAQLEKAVADGLEEVEGMRSLLNALMDISEAQTGVMRLDLATVDLPAMVGDMAELYRYLAEEKSITLSVQAPDSLAVRADLTRLRQVFANLLDNALKYTRTNGNILVTVTKDDGHATVSVRDNGVGITQEELPLIWQRRYRGRSGGSSDGLGLGLGVVKAIVEAHHGYVSVASTYGEGSVFSFSLPLNG